MTPTSTGAGMFVAIYRWRLHPGREQDFIAHWRFITRQGLAAGSGGSALFRDEQGLWVAIARWPTRDARDRFFREREDASDADLAERARQAVIERLPTQELESVLDLWVLPADAIGAGAP